MKRMIALLLFVSALPATAGAQCFGGGELSRVLAGPCAERMFRQAYAPVDYALGQAGQYAGYGYPVGYGYGPGGYGRTAAIATGAMTGMAAGAAIGAGFGHNTRSALIGAGAGAAVGGLLTYAVTRPRGYDGQTYAGSGHGQVIFAQPRAQKPLDCRKPSGKRGKNEAACAAAEREIGAAEDAAKTAAKEEADRQALAASPWRLYNRSGFTVEVFDGGRRLGRMRPNQSWRVLEPASGYRAVILAPDFSGAITEHEARIRPANDFQGWVITAPKEDQ